MIDIITLVVLILSIVLHEVAHGYAANWLGDPTARLAGRLSANPLLHIDPFGSIIIPAILYILGAPFLFGYAKPVPYNPYNLRNQKWGESVVAVAGPLANFLLAGIFAILVRLSATLAFSGDVTDMMAHIVFINLLLGLFNLIPLPPLDGSKAIVGLLPLGLSVKYQVLMRRVESMGLLSLFLSVFIFMFILWGPFSNLVWWVFHIFVGA